MIDSPLYGLLWKGKKLNYSWLGKIESEAGHILLSWPYPSFLTINIAMSCDSIWYYLLQIWTYGHICLCLNLLRGLTFLGAFLLYISLFLSHSFFTNLFSTYFSHYSSLSIFLFSSLTFRTLFFFLLLAFSFSQNSESFLSSLRNPLHHHVWRTL